MSISTVDIEIPSALNVTVTPDTLSVDLSDGRTISAPLAWFPRLLNATPAERNKWRLIGKGHGIHWEAIDEDISVEGLLAGRPSGESQTSFEKWLRGAGPARDPGPRSAAGAVVVSSRNNSDSEPDFWGEKMANPILKQAFLNIVNNQSGRAIRRRPRRRLSGW